MSDIVIPVAELEEDADKRYDNIPLSDIATAGCNLSSDDRMWFVRMVKMQDQYTENLIATALNIRDEVLTKVFGDIIKEQIMPELARISTAINQINASILEINTKIEVIDNKVARVEEKRKEDSLKILELEKRFDDHIRNHCHQPVECAYKKLNP